MAPAPNVKLVVYMEYFGTKLIDAQYIPGEALEVVRRDLVDLGLPHPKGTNIVFPAPNAAQGYWLSNTGTILHKNLVIRIKTNKPDRATLDGMSMLSITLYEIFDDLSDEQPTVTPPSSSVTFPPPRSPTKPAPSPNKAGPSSNKDMSPPPATPPIKIKRRFSDAFPGQEAGSTAPPRGPRALRVGSPHINNIRDSFSNDTSSKIPPNNFDAPNNFGPSTMAPPTNPPLDSPNKNLQHVHPSRVSHVKLEEELDKVDTATISVPPPRSFSPSSHSGHLTTNLDAKTRSDHPPSNLNSSSNWDSNARPRDRSNSESSSANHELPSQSRLFSSHHPDAKYTSSYSHSHSHSHSHPYSTTLPRPHPNDDPNSVPVLQFRLQSTQRAATAANRALAQARDELDDLRRIHSGCRASSSSHAAHGMSSAHASTAHDTSQPASTEVHDKCRAWGKTLKKLLAEEKDLLAEEKKKSERLERRVRELESGGGGGGKDELGRPRGNSDLLGESNSDGDANDARLRQKLAETEKRLGETEARLHGTTRRLHESEKREDDYEERWREEASRRREETGRRRDAGKRVVELEERLGDEVGRRREAERLLEDVRRECMEPFVVPGLLDAFVEVCKMGDWVMKGG